MSEHRFVPLDWCPLSEQEMARRAREFRMDASQRRTVRHFSDRPVPRGLIEDCILAAGTAGRRAA